MVQIIGITGKKFHGKDTVGNILIKNYGFERMAYADPLKEACRAIFGFNDDQLYGNSKEVVDDFWNTTPRQLLQFIGTDLFRNNIEQVLPDVGKDIWIKSLEKQIINKSKDNPNLKVVITDVRFPNEAELINKMGGKVIKVTRPSINSNDSHESEILIDSIEENFHIYNDKDIAYLEESIKNIFDNF